MYPNVVLSGECSAHVDCEVFCAMTDFQTEEGFCIYVMLQIGAVARQQCCTFTLQ